MVFVEQTTLLSSRAGGQPCAQRKGGGRCPVQAQLPDEVILQVSLPCYGVRGSRPPAVQMQILSAGRRWMLTSLFLLEKQNANRSSEKPFLVLRFLGHVLEHTGKTEGCTDGELGINQASPPLCPRPSVQPQLGLWPHWASPPVKSIEMKHEPV